MCYLKLHKIQAKHYKWIMHIQVIGMGHVCHYDSKYIINTILLHKQKLHTNKDVLKNRYLLARQFGILQSIPLEFHFQEFDV